MAERTDQPTFWQAWLQLFGAVYAVMLVAGATYLLWQSTTPWVPLPYQLFYAGLYLAMGAAPVAVQTGVTTLLIRLRPNPSLAYRLLLSMLTAALLMAWAYPHPFFGVPVGAAGAGAILASDAIPIPRRWRLLLLSLAALPVMHLLSIK